MKRMMLAGSLMLAAGTSAFGDQLYWVVGDRSTKRCDIVTTNPVVFDLPAYHTAASHAYWFGDGPYKSKDDARLARATIHVCPAESEEPADK